MDIVKFEKKITSETLEEALIFLCKFGNPKLSRMRKGWYARIDMHVSSEGVAFEIKTDFDLKTPSEAVNQLMKRIQQTLTDLNGG